MFNRMTRATGKGIRTMTMTTTATETMRVEKESFHGGRTITEFLSLLNDGRIRKSVVTTRRNDGSLLGNDGSPLAWKTIGTTDITSAAWLNIVRSMGFELTDAVHQVC